MKRQEVILLLAAALVIGYIGVDASGGVKAGKAKVNVALKSGLVNTTARDSGVQVASPWDTSARRNYEYNRWSCPPWSLESVGATPLRDNHPLHRRPNYIGENRHQVMMNGWYYCNPANEVL